MQEVKKLDFSPVPNTNTISLHDYQLILCMLGFLHKLLYEIRKPIPKGTLVIITETLWELACEFRPVINQLLITQRNRIRLRKAA